MIVLNNLERVYKAGPTTTYVLRRINLEIKEGEVRYHHGAVGSRQVHAAEYSWHA